MSQYDKSNWSQTPSNANEQLARSISNWLRWFLYIDTDIVLYDRHRTSYEQFKVNAYRVCVSLGLITYAIRMILLDLANDHESRHQLGDFYV